MKEHFHNIKIISVRFIDSINKEDKLSQDLYCTAISRCANKRKKVVIEISKHRCSGGNYFIGNNRIKFQKLSKVYVDKESVFKDENALKKFLKIAERNPKKSRYVVFDPEVTDRADVVVMLLSPDDAGRILGLNSFNGDFKVDIIPSISSCASIYRPLVKKNSIHVNFIDYFDREYQCKGFFKKSEMIVSMSLKIYKKLQSNVVKSSHGSNFPEGMEIYDVPKL